MRCCIVKEEVAGAVLFRAGIEGQNMSTFWASRENIDWTKPVAWPITQTTIWALAKSLCNFEMIAACLRTMRWAARWWTGWIASQLGDKSKREKHAPSPMILVSLAA